MEEKDSFFLQCLAQLSRALFCQVDPQDILDGTLFFDDISFQTAADYMMLDSDTSLRYSRMECRKTAEFAADFVYERRKRHFSGSQEITGCLSAFSILVVLAELLLRPDEPVVCRYEQLIPWRQITKMLGEELPTAAMYAQKDLDSGIAGRKNFDWGAVIGHDNRPLNAAMERGISEHHFHLFSSLPYFQVSWVNLMNAVNWNYYLDNLRRIEQQSKVWQKDDYITALLNHKADRAGTSTLILHQMQAALIRIYLFQRLCEPVPYIQKPPFGGMDRVYRLLRNPELLQLTAAEIQDEIAFWQDTPGEDYALNQTANNRVEDARQFRGERWFLYAMLRDIYAELHSRRLSREEHNLFYAYLCLQNELRAQMVQINGYVGFDNFQVYERRRGYFFPPDAESLWLSARLAVREPLLKAPYLRELEVRVSPSDTALGNYQWIAQLDRAIYGSDALPGEPEPPDLRNRYYYVYHFIKRPDRTTARLSSVCQKDELQLQVQQYRHEDLRSKLERQAKALLAFRETYPQTACRVHGIDAASQEIECRPEVFAPIFRMLHAHQPAKTYPMAPQLPQLRKTYHAGEDFLDVVDGLRAIDESIHFLELGYGDRIGHAIALGIDVAEWYENKKQQIVLSKQDYLDNLAWMNHALTQYHLECADTLREFLRSEFDRYFHEVYQLHGEASQDLETYYKAWCLRGDHPSLYRNGVYEAPPIPVDDLDRCRTNFSFPQPFSERYIQESAALYYRYHYDPFVKSAGKTQISVRVPKIYSNACAQIQACMQRKVADRGIAIETNPSSNVLISTFREYHKHPIYHFYNKHLVHGTEQDACAQLHVSINTDDNGVFFTSIENEYALMARATELILDEETERPRYKKADIYEWLDDIRKMSNEQGFPGGIEEERIEHV